MTNTMAEIPEEVLDDLYSWIDRINLSRPKRDLKRDFSDGVLVAEVINHFNSRLVDLHSYSSANNATNKMKNWNLLNRKVFKKLDFELEDDVIKNIVECRSWAIEHFLMMLRRKVDMYIFELKRSKDKGKGDSPGKTNSNIKTTPIKENKIIVKKKEIDLNINQNANPPKTLVKKVTTKSIVSAPQIVSSSQGHLNQHIDPNSPAYRVCRDHQMVSKVIVEEKEQELLVKAETIQILQAKVRRLEHLVHLKDCRIDDLQLKLEQLESRLLEVPRQR